MLRKGLLALFCAAALSASAFAADIVVRVRPPHAVVETRPVAPGVGYVWTPGYQRWDGNAYVWAPGSWQRPPHEHQRWVSHRWVHHHDGWVMEEGHWR
jgi:hypothetical protein